MKNPPPSVYTHSSGAGRTLTPSPSSLLSAPGSKSLCYSHSPQARPLSTESKANLGNSHLHSHPGLLELPTLHTPVWKTLQPHGQPPLNQTHPRSCNLRPICSCPAPCPACPHHVLLLPAPPPTCPWACPGTWQCWTVQIPTLAHAGPLPIASRLPSSRPWGESQEADPGPGQPSHETTAVVNSLRNFTRVLSLQTQPSTLGFPAHGTCAVMQAFCFKL